MEIINANKLEYQEEILDLAERIKGQKRTREQLTLWLKFNLGTDNFGVWLAAENGRAIGFVACEIVEQYDPKVFIALIYVKTGKSGMDVLLSKVEEWAKEKDIKTIIVHWSRSPNTFIKKFGFQLKYSILIKDI